MATEDRQLTMQNPRISARTRSFGFKNSTRKCMRFINVLCRSVVMSVLFHSVGECDRGALQTAKYLLSVDH